MSVSPTEFASFLANTPVKLASFVEIDLPANIEIEGEEPKPFTKDFSPQSLPWVETFAVSHLVSPAQATQPENLRFTEGLMRYVGEVFLRAFGGKWDYDPAGEVGDGMPFIRPDSAAGEFAGEPGSVVGLIMTALKEQNSRVFLDAFTATLAGFDGKAPTRGATGMHGVDTSTGVEPLSPEERKFLGSFLPTVEGAVAAWVNQQANPADWNYNTESLERLGRQLTARYETVAQLEEERSEFWVAGALRFIGEAMRQAGNGTWRYGATFDNDDPRGHQVFIQYGLSKIDLVPWRLMRACFDDPQSLVNAFEAVRQQANAEGTA